jgi:hypothetical protein
LLGNLWFFHSLLPNHLAQTTSKWQDVYRIAWVCPARETMKVPHVHLVHVKWPLVLDHNWLGCKIVVRISGWGGSTRAALRFLRGCCGQQ